MKMKLYHQIWDTGDTILKGKLTTLDGSCKGKSVKSVSNLKDSPILDKGKQKKLSKSSYVIIILSKKSRDQWRKWGTRGNQ